MPDRHGNQKVTDEEILAAFDEIAGPFVTASELADVLPISRTAVRNRLEKLHERGLIGRKQPIQQMIGWWKYDGGENENENGSDPQGVTNSSR